MKAQRSSGKRTKQAAASGKAARRADPRARRTRGSLAGALMKLMRQKPFAEITVQNVLDEAGIGRSTFYEHYRGKEDLFLSDIDEFFERVASRFSRSGE